jgi:hypothetical protein
LNPYIYAAAAEAAATGVPIVRHPFLMHPDEPAALSVELEYYFGDALYVAPMVVRDATSRSLWLPPGGWFDWWTYQWLSGGRRIDRATPLDELPLWLRSGTIVAMLDPAVQTIAPGPTPGVVTPDDVSGVLDARAGVDAAAPTGSATLADGTILETSLAKGDLALPKGFAQAPDDATLATCARCGRVDDVGGGVTRVRLTGSASGEETIVAGALRVRHHSLEPIRLRWDVLVKR